MSLTAKTTDWSLVVGDESFLWHLKEKLFLGSGLEQDKRMVDRNAYEASLSSTYLRQVVRYLARVNTGEFSLDSDTALDCSNGKSVRQRETGNHPGLPLQRGSHGLARIVVEWARKKPSMFLSLTLYGAVGLVRLKIWMCRSAVPTTISG